MRLKLQSQRTNQGGAQHSRQFTTGEVNAGPRKPSSFPILMPEHPFDFLANSLLSAPKLPVLNLCIRPLDVFQSVVRQSKFLKLLF